MLPATIIVLIFFVVPVLLLVSEGSLNHGRFSAAAYRTVLTEPYYAYVLWRSILLSLVSTAICILFGYPIAFYTARLSGYRYKRYIFMIVLAPLFTSAVIRATVSPRADRRDGESLLRRFNRMVSSDESRRRRTAGWSASVACDVRVCMRRLIHYNHELMHMDVGRAR